MDSAYVYPENECHDRNADQADYPVQQVLDDFFEGVLMLHHGAGFRFVFHGCRGNCDQYRKEGYSGRRDVQAWTPDVSNRAGLDAAAVPGLDAAPVPGLVNLSLRPDW